MHAFDQVLGSQGAGCCRLGCRTVSCHGLRGHDLRHLPGTLRPPRSQPTGKDIARASGCQRGIPR